MSILVIIIIFECVEGEDFFNGPHFSVRLSDSLYILDFFILASGERLDFFLSRQTRRIYILVKFLLFLMNEKLQNELRTSTWVKKNVVPLSHKRVIDQGESLYLSGILHFGL